VGEHVSNSDIGKSENGILESDEVEPVNGEQELFFSRTVMVRECSTRSELNAWILS